MKNWQLIKQVGAVLLVTLAVSARAFAGDFTITSIQPVFNAATPNAGQFKVRVGLKNNANEPRQVNLACMYLGLSQPGMYVKGEPQIQKQYLVVNLKPGQQTDVVLKNKFAAWHPETVGELVVTLVGENTARSQSVETKFRPGSPD